MSFQEQERLLFNLMFDKNVLLQFEEDREGLFDDYQLTVHEKLDFTSLRYDALLLDVQMRRRLILSQMSKTFPLSFSLISSMDSGLDLIESLLDGELMRVPGFRRASCFSGKMLHAMQQSSMQGAESEQELQALLAIMRCEHSMASSAAELKAFINAGNQLDSQAQFYDEDVSDWLERPLQLAAYVTTELINQPYMHLKKQLCPKSGSMLWAHLQGHPLPSFLRQDALLHDNPRCIVSRATVTHESVCDPVVDHLTVELSAGFAPMFKHIDGANSINDMLANLRMVGAPETLLASVHSGFYQLLQAGMLTLSD